MIFWPSGGGRFYQGVFCMRINYMKTPASSHSLIITNTYPGTGHSSQTTIQTSSNDSARTPDPKYATSSVESMARLSANALTITRSYSDGTLQIKTYGRKTKEFLLTQVRYFNKNGKWASAQSQILPWNLLPTLPDTL